MSDARALGSTFAGRDAPDAAAYVQRSISSSPYRYVARVRYQTSEQFIAQHFSPASVTIEADGPDACIVTAGADDPERMVFYFATVGVDFEVLEPPEVVHAVDAAADRLRRAAVTK
jgi:predicted DNA-binding transcriptional regulator YafY